MTNEEDLQNMSTVPFDELREEFREQIDVLKHQLMDQVRVKEVRGIPLDGHMLANLFESYMHSINQGAVPKIQNAETFIF